MCVGGACGAHLNDVETDVLVEGVEDEFGQAGVAPRSVNQEQLLQEAELHTHHISFFPLV